MTPPVETLSPLLPDGATVLVPTGWQAIQVGAGAVLDVEPSMERGAAEPPLAGGVVERTSDVFGSSVLIYPGHREWDAPAHEFGAGQTWHDSQGDGAVRRVVVRYGETAALATTSLHLWTTVEDHPVMVVAIWASDRMDEQWPVVERVLRSIVDGPGVWEAWL